jgi:hypothetical protein
MSSKYGNARYHIQRILSLLDEYPVSLVESAIERATLFGAFGHKAIQNICRQEEQPESPPVELIQKVPLTNEPVEERSLSYYSLLEG